MINVLIKLNLRKAIKKLFREKLYQTRRLRYNRIRKVRKFSSNFLFEKKKKLFFNLMTLKEFKLKNRVADVFFNFPRRYINNKSNVRVTTKNAKAFIKLRKVKKMKKSSRRYKTLSFYRKFPRELFTKNPLNRFYNSNIELLSFNYSYLLNFHAAIGNTAKFWINPSVFSKILAIRNDMILYDLTFTFICLRKGLQTVFQLSKLKASVLGYVSLDKNYKFSGVGFDHFLRSWLPGYLTNYKQVMKNILSLQTKNIFNLTRRQKKFLQNIDLKRNIPFNFYYHFWREKKLQKREYKKIPCVPSFGFSLEDYSIWINECQKVGIRTMAVCDSESFPHKVDYPLISNQQSLPLSFFLVKLVSESISSGKRFDYFSFIGFNVVSQILNKVDDRLKMSFNQKYQS